MFDNWEYYSSPISLQIFFSTGFINYWKKIVKISKNNCASICLFLI